MLMLALNLSQKLAFRDPKPVIKHIIERDTFDVTQIRVIPSLGHYDEFSNVKGGGGFGDKLPLLMKYSQWRAS